MRLVPVGAPGVAAALPSPTASLTVAPPQTRVASAARSDAALRRRRQGIRAVAAASTVAFAFIVLAAGFVLANSMLAAGQVVLTGLERDIADEREMLVALQFEMQIRQAPVEVETLSRGALGLTDAAEPVDLVVEPRHIGAIATPDGFADVGSGDWTSLKLLFADIRQANGQSY